MITVGSFYIYRQTNKATIHDYAKHTKPNRSIPQKQKGYKKSKPARILRPGAETKVGGSPLTTMGFKAP